MPHTKRHSYYPLTHNGAASESTESLMKHATVDYDDSDQGPRAAARPSWARWHVAAYTALLASNVMLALALSVVLRRPATNLAPVAVRPNMTRYASLVEDVAVTYPYSTGYGPEVTNHSLADERWEAIDIDDGVILLDDAYVAAHNLPPSQRFPWDPTQGVYLLNSFHNLHCLKNIHRLLYDAHHGRPLSRDIGHAMHCVDHMRKDLMCAADDFPLPSPPSRHELPGPRGQTRVCRDWDQLVAWARQRNACYTHVTDDEAGFAAEHHEIERYRHCPADSPYYAVAQKYFATHDVDHV